MKITDDMVREFAEDAVGTCNPLYETFSSMYPGCDFDELSQEQLEIFDDIAFTCAYCGWVYDLGEESGYDEDERICNNCAEEVEDFE